MGFSGGGWWSGESFSLGKLPGSDYLVQMCNILTTEPRGETWEKLCQILAPPSLSLLIELSFWSHQKTHQANFGLA